MSAAVHSLKKNYKVYLFESSNFPGGRCRSFYEKRLNQEIDNGNHLVFTANENFYELCKIIKSTDTIKTLPPNLNFFNLNNNSHWSIDLSKISSLRLLLGKNKPIPNSSFIDYLSILKFLFVNRHRTVSEIIGGSNIFSTLWDPLTIGVMNTSSNYASAKVLSNVLKKTVLRGDKYCYIYQPKINWNKTLIQPTINFLNNHGCRVQYKSMLRKIDVLDNAVTRLYFTNQVVDVLKNEIVVLSIPPSNLQKLLPQYTFPSSYNSIVNVHYKLNRNLKKKFKHSIIGFIESNTQWIFIKKNHISITISNANYLNSYNTEEIATLVWKEVCKYLNLKIGIPDYQVVKEKKATVVQSPKNFDIVEKIKNLPNNLRISGDWTQSDLPCTIEGSILSGRKAVT